MGDEAGLSVEQIHAQYRDRKLSPRELVEAQLQRIERWNEHVHAFITVDGDGARAQARKLEQELLSNDDIGDLFGIPVAVKDVIPVAGLPFTEGAARFKERVAESDALSVARLRRAGAIILGKTNTPEFASYMNTRSSVGGTTLNPWNLEMSSGGSSGGSAVAVALGMATLALGTDHGGSVRIPAALNGVAGLRSTPGTVPVWPSAWVHDPFDVHGPIARVPDDLDAALGVLAGPDARVPISGPSHSRGSYSSDQVAEQLSRARVGYTVDFDGMLLVESSIRRAIEAALPAFNGFVSEVREAAPPLHAGVSAIPKLRQFRGLIEHRERMDDLSSLENPLLRELLRDAQNLTAQEVATAFATRSDVALRGASYFSNHDLLVLPTTQFPSFEASALGPVSVDGQAFSDPLASSLVTYLLSVVGWPSITVPCGVASNQVPVGIQIAGPPGAERLVLAAGARFMHEFPATPELPVMFRSN